MKNEKQEETIKCLNCKLKPCSQKGCPLHNNIPGFIEALKKEEYVKSYRILSETTVLSGICGKICPHDKQCQGSCVRGIKGKPVSIGELENFVYEKAKEQNYKLADCYEKKEKKNKKVAIIGGGPSGLTCAAFLAKEGIDVTIYEKYTYLGGLLVFGIPEFRLEKNRVEEVVKQILELGIKVEYEKELGRNLKLEELEKEYDAIFLSIGANKSTKMGIEGEELNGVYGGNELLEYNLHPEYKNKNVAIIGGGNVAIDCARTIKKLGAKKVTILYRREEEQMPAERKEIEEAKKEGIEFAFKNNIVKIIGEKSVEKIELIRTELIKKEEEERLSPVNIENSNYTIDMDYVIMALGSKTSETVNKIGLELNKWGNIKIDEKYRTSKEKVYAGGDLAGIKGTVAWAAYSGREAAKNILIDIIKQ